MNRGRKREKQRGKSRGRTGEGQTQRVEERNTGRKGEKKRGPGSCDNRFF